MIYFDFFLDSGFRVSLLFAHRRISEVDRRVQGSQIKPDLKSEFHFIPKVLDGVEVEALCIPDKLFHTKVEKKLITLYYILSQ